MLELADRIEAAHSRDEYAQLLWDNDALIVTALRASAPGAAVGEALEQAAEFARSAIDRHLGDSDPPNYTSNPLFHACQKLSAALSSIPQLPTVDVRAREITDEMLDAHLKATNEWVEPFTAERESGEPIECDISPEEAAEINATSRAYLRKGYAAARASLPKAQDAVQGHEVGRQWIVDLVREQYDQKPRDCPADWDDGAETIADSIIANLLLLRPTPAPAVALREIIVPYNPCLAKLRPGEPFFVLLGRDQQAPNAIMTWANDREAAEGRSPWTEQAREVAYKIAAYSGVRDNGAA